ncbi:PspC domain-containing protein [Shewanella sp. Isolate7]|uniref:PspC domain-containing protein n=1 Tax=Shewanella sp. Isolate7 TaxID=2908528 RepID=UPI001EFC4890|nr:PspC domain-containing protein [Shewanella sp. Isolate7]MCG9720333.1 PspC domain-containing protein [Shewanella sp. Isolate7]
MTDLESIKILTRGDKGVIAGVCSGLADYYGLRVNGLRIAFVLTSLFFFLPVLVYLGKVRISPVLALRVLKVDRCKAQFAANGPSPSQEL